MQLLNLTYAYEYARNLPYGLQKVVHRHRWPRTRTFDFGRALTGLITRGEVMTRIDSSPAGLT